MNYLCLLSELVLAADVSLQEYVLEVLVLLLLMLLALLLNEDDNLFLFMFVKELLLTAELEE